MHNLLELFGQKYRVDFDRESYTVDKKITDSCKGKLTVEKPWYYSIPCKYGYISISSYKDDLSFYCDSARVARRIEKATKGKPVKCNITDFDALIYFKLADIEDIFRIAQSKRKRQLSQEQGKNLASRFRKSQATETDFPP